MKTAKNIMNVCQSDIYKWFNISRKQYFVLYYIDLNLFQFWHLCYDPHLSSISPLNVPLSPSFSLCLSPCLSLCVCLSLRTRNWGHYVQLWMIHPHLCMRLDLRRRQHWGRCSWGEGESEQRSEWYADVGDSAIKSTTEKLQKVIW